MTEMIDLYIVGYGEHDDYSEYTILAVDAEDALAKFKRYFQLNSRTIYDKVEVWKGEFVDPGILRKQGDPLLKVDGDLHALCTGCCPCCGEHCPEEGGTSCGGGKNHMEAGV